MSISRSKPSTAVDNGGYTLVEMLVAMGIGSMLTMYIASFLVGAGQIQKDVTKRAELESLRSIALPQIDCNKPCAGLTELRKDHGPWQLEVRCHSMYRDASVIAINEQSKLRQPLFTLDSWVCRSRRPKQCIYACHNNGELLERGYLFPSLEMKYVPDGDLSCPLGEMVGIDFSTNRIICEPKSVFPSGPMCKQDTELVVALDDTHTVAIAGETPCHEHTQDRVRIAKLSGALKVDLATDFNPKRGDTFTIIRAENIQGRFSNPNNRAGTSRGSFAIKYTSHAVVLHDFRSE